jgi:thioredoxin 1
MSVPLTKMSLDILLRDLDELIILDFYANWCQPCKSLSKSIDNYYTDKIKNFTLIKINVDSQSDISEFYNIQSLPTLIFYKGNKILDKLEGNNFEVLLEKIRKYS